MYSAYNASFFEAMTNGMSIATSFEALTDTAFWEKYMTNAFQFSAAKNKAEMKILQSLIFDKNKTRRSFSEFKKAAKPYLDDFNKVWMRTEYDLASRGAVMAEEWQTIWADRDINPYAIYRTRKDGRVREEHAELEGLVLDISSPKAQQIYPPNGWNCRCRWETTSEGKPISDKQVEKHLKQSVAKEFQGNVGMQGIMPNDTSYFDVLPSANSANYKLFNSSLSLTSLNKRMMSDYDNMLLLKSWSKNDTDKKNTDIIFRNHKWLLNVRLTQNSLDNIGKKTRGIENIKSTIEKPAEIWARWENPNEQKVVLMNYIKFDGKDAYIVETKSGIITDAKLIRHNDSINNRRIGIKLIR
jgi:hypothetical protein